jgi:hypothetical protein
VVVEVHGDVIYITGGHAGSAPDLCRKVSALASGSGFHTVKVSVAVGISQDPALTDATCAVPQAPRTELPRPRL